MAQHVETLVIGAGPAGLTSAYALAKAGRAVTVLEMDPVYVGGLARTVDYKGFKVDIGGHRFNSTSQTVVDLWNEILPEDFIDRPHRSRIYYREKFYAYPLKAFEALAHLGAWTATRCLASFGWAKLRPIQEPATFHQWARNHFGEKVFSIFFKAHTEKVVGMSCDEISADWASQRIKDVSLIAAIFDGVRRSLGLKPKAAGEGAPRSLAHSFRYPRKGPGMVWEACAEKIQDMGGVIRLGRKIQGLHYDKSAKLWTVSVSCAEGSAETYTADNVVSSAPIRELVGALSPTPISVFHAGELMYRDLITVSLIGRPRKPLPDNWIYIHDPSVKAARIQNFRSWSPEMVPDADSACLGLEYACFEGDHLWALSDADLVALAHREVAKIGLMEADDIRDASVVRQRKAYPVYDDAYAQHIKMIRLDLKLHFPGLHLIGRNGMHKSNNQDHAMMTGLLTAQNIIAGEPLHDVWAVGGDAAYGGAKAPQTDRSRQAARQAA